MFVSATISSGLERFVHDLGKMAFITKNLGEYQMRKLASFVVMALAVCTLSACNGHNDDNNNDCWNNNWNNGWWF